ncbi:hypothetical protein MMC07_002034 [Pseudocyphellaria aurata]|nr:hypothetical protein [Pseudocyphellaria aurata]
MARNEQPTSVSFETDLPPRSSPDPYSSPASAIDGSQLPYHPNEQVRDAREEVLQDYLQQRAANVRRPLTPDETSALTYHMARRYRFIPYASTVSGLSGTLAALATRKTYGNAFFGSMKREGGFFDGERIRTMGIEICRGAKARFLIHTIRFANYNIVSTVVTAAVAGIISNVSFLNATSQDPRLKDLNADTEMIRRQERKEREEELRKRLQTRTTPRQAKSAMELGKEHRAALEREETRQDVGSILAGSGGTEYASNEGMVGGRDELRENGNREFDFGESTSGAPIKSQQIRPQPVPRMNPLPNRTAAERQPTRFSEPEPEPMHDPDPSPSDWGREASDGGSAWERIRRGAGSSTEAAASDKMKERRGTRGVEGRQRPQQQQQQREKREQRNGSGRWGGGSSSGGGDDFSFSSSEQERSYAQEEAQRDFDARVEKERRGGDFSEGSGGRRWG